MLKSTKYSAIAVILLLGACCIVVSVPTFYLVNIYRMTYRINPSDALTSFIKMLPVLLFLVVLVYGAICTGRLANNGKMRDAGKLSVLLIVLLLAEIIVVSFTFNIGIRYVM
jgi:hypothetical protein